MSANSWWQRSVIYQIYPRSYQDSNSDGVGDLPGITQRLAYLVDLGIDAVWLSPIFTSPMHDFGYDIADYCDIDPLFGSMEDFDELLVRAHELGLKVLLDFVPNHTSSTHPWFVESRSSRGNPKRDWYLWCDPDLNGGPPNNWLSEFGGSAWEFDKPSGQYYYHAFLASQPDLNWRNPEVRRAMHDIMRFWLRKGIDGFRIDVLWHLIKDEQLRDNPANPGYKPGDPPHWAVLPLYTTDRPEVHDVVSGFRAVANEFPHRLLIGEIYLPPKRLIAYYGKNLEGVHLPFNFGLLEMRWHARDIAVLIDEYERALPIGSWPNWVLGNHDRPRIATRVGVAQARVAAMLLLTLRGTPTMYYGDEIGQTDTKIGPDQVCDPLGRSVPSLGRDGSRGPMRWEEAPYGGFSNVQPWCVCPGAGDLSNVASERCSASSILNLYRRLLEVRKSSAALSMGDYAPLVATGDVLLYERSYPGASSMVVALNLGDQPATAFIDSSFPAGQVIVSTFNDRNGEVVKEEINLRPNEGLVIELLHD
jgi:alpha-glucosidase